MYVPFERTEYAGDANKFRVGSERASTRLSLPCCDPLCLFVVVVGVVVGVVAVVVTVVSLLFLPVNF